MRYKPSAVESYIATLPEDLQKLAMSEILREHDRIGRGEFTPEEKKINEMITKMVIYSRRKIELIALDVFNDRK